MPVLRRPRRFSLAAMFSLISIGFICAMNLSVLSNRVNVILV